MMNKEFDLYQKIEKMNWTMKSTSYAYFVFVIWITTQLSKKSSTKKNHVMMNIRNLNKIFEFDVYSISLQTNIIFCVQDCEYIFIMNYVTFFHQWFVIEENRHKFTMMTHRDSKRWNVTIMKYRNIATYVQRKNE